MKKLLTIIGFLGLGISASQAQTTMSAGDLAFTGFASDNPDEFSFVLLTNITAGTELYFSDRGWDSIGGAFYSSEGYFTWKTNVNLASGTVISCEDLTGAAGTDYGCTIGETANPSARAMQLSASGDQLFAFQGDTINPVFISGINFGSTDWKDDGSSISSNTSYLPGNLTNGSSAVSVGNVDNGYYTGDSINLLATLKADLFDPANWTSNGNRADFDPSENARQGFYEVMFGPQVRIAASDYDYDFGQTSVNTAVGPMVFYVGGQNLSANLVVTAPAPFQVREQGTGSYASSVSITPSSGTVNPTAIEVRYYPSAGGNSTEIIDISSTGAFTSQVRVNGQASSQPQVGFVGTSTTFDENSGLGSIQVFILNKGGNTVNVNVNSKSTGYTALENVHYSFPNGPSVVFDINSADTLSIPIMITDDAVSGPRFRMNKLGLDVTSADKYTGLDSFDLSIAENDYEVRSIASIKQLDNNFNPISADSLFEVRGIVYGTNTRTSGFSFTIVDPTAGISNYAPASAPTFGYNITEGDSIMMRGRLTHFNGLVQLDYLDTIRLIQAGVGIQAPIVVNNIDESTENILVRVNKVQLGSIIPTWDPGSSGRNYWVYSTTSSDSFEIRVLPTSTLANTAAPTGVFDVIGIGGQYDGSEPRNGGYQLMPRYASDVIIDLLGDFDLISPANNATVQLQGDPAQTVTISWSTSEALSGAAAPTYSFLVTLPTSDFSSPLLSLPSDNSGADTTLTLSYGALADALSASLAPGGSLTLKWTVKATSGGQEEWAASEYLITFERGIINGVVKVSNLARIYPNPAKNMVNIDLTEEGGSLSLIDASGKTVRSQNITSLSNQINLEGLKQGVYFIKIEQNGKQSISKLVVSNR